MKKHQFYISIAIAVGIIILWLNYDRMQKGKRIEELEKLIDQNQEVDADLKKKLQKLIHQYQGVNPKVSNELISALALIEIKQKSKAAFSLAKIIENLLKKRYQNDEKFKSKSRVSFHKLLDHAKESNDISSDQYFFAKGLKEIRNEEGHELDVEKDDSWFKSALYIGIGLILKLDEKVNFLPGSINHG